MLKDLSSNWNETAGIGQEKPRLQWTGGKLKTLEFDALFFLEINKGDLEGVLDTFEYLVEKDDKLLRPPTCDFQYGKNVFLKCIVEEISNVQLSEARKDGKLRSVKAHFKLKEYVPFDLEEAGSAEEETAETRYVHAKDGDTFESLAAVEYGDALKGEVLRQRARGVVDLEVNDVVKLLDPDHPAILAPVLPKAIPFKTGSEAAVVKGFERRGGSSIIL